MCVDGAIFCRHGEHCRCVVPNEAHCVLHLSSLPALCHLHTTSLHAASGGQLLLQEVTRSNMPHSVFLEGGPFQKQLSPVEKARTLHGSAQQDISCEGKETCMAPAVAFCCCWGTQISLIPTRSEAGRPLTPWLAPAEQIDTVNYVCLFWESSYCIMPTTTNVGRGKLHVLKQTSFWHAYEYVNYYLCNDCCTLKVLPLFRCEGLIAIEGIIVTTSAPQGFCAQNP